MSGQGASEDDGGPPMPGVPSLGLVMIVRNEGSTLPRLAASVAGQVDLVTLVDTGSTDETIQVAARAFGDLSVSVVRDEWRGFGESRNVALHAAAPGSDWLLFMDADETLTGKINRSSLSAQLDAVEICRQSGPTTMWLPRLVAAGRNWAWRGRTHEYLSLDGGRARTARSTSCLITHHGDGGSRAEKYERDLGLLALDWADMPGDPRTAFYTARTYDDLGRYPEAVQWYRQRVDLGAWEEERWYAAYRLGVCLLSTGAVKEGRQQLWSAWRQRRHRAEPLVALAENCRVAKDWPEAWRATRCAFSSTAAQPDGPLSAQQQDVLFIDADTYTWRVAYEASMAAWYVGERRRGKYYSDYLLFWPGVPQLVRSAVRSNLKFYRS